MSDLLNPKVVKDLAENIRAVRETPALTEWDMDIPPDNRFHDPFQHHARQPEPLWTRFQASFHTYEEAVHAICALRDLMKTVEMLKEPAHRYDLTTAAIRQADYETALRVITGVIQISNV